MDKNTKKPDVENLKEITNEVKQKNLRDSDLKKKQMNCRQQIGMKRQDIADKICGTLQGERLTIGEAKEIVRKVSGMLDQVRVRFEQNEM